MGLAGLETDHVVRGFIYEDADFHGMTHNRAHQSEQRMIRFCIRQWRGLDGRWRGRGNDRRRPRATRVRKQRKRASF